MDFSSIEANATSDTKKPEAFSTSLYVTDKAAYEECKRLLKLQGRSLSEEIMDFVLRRRDELKGNGSSTDSSIDSTRRLEILKAEHFKVLQKIDKLKVVLGEKKVLGDYRDRFAKVVGYDPGEKAWDGDECARVLGQFLRHSNDDVWKRAETKFLVSNRFGGLVHTFLDLCECYREQFKIERKLLELRTSSEELARLDALERQTEEEGKKEAELRKQRETEEALGQPKEEDESEESDEEDSDEEDSEEEEDYEEEGELGTPTVTVLTEDEKGPPGECRAIVPVKEIEENGDQSGQP